MVTIYNILFGKIKLNGNSKLFNKTKNKLRKTFIKIRFKLLLTKSFLLM